MKTRILFGKATGIIVVISMLALFVLASNVSVQTAFGQVSQAQTLSGTETQLTNAPADQLIPEIAGNLVVYTDFARVETDVWYTDLTTGLQHVVSTEEGDQQLTGVSDNRIVYTDWYMADVMVYNVATGETLNLTSAARSNCLDPAISHNLVAWTDDRDGNAEIYARDLVSGEERRITNGLLVDQAPAVGDGIIVWESCDHYTCDVFAYDWAGRTTTRLTNTPSASERSSSVSGRTVVFQREHGTPVDSDLVAYDLDTGVERVLALSGDQRYPHISGDFVSFDYYDSTSGRPYIGLWQISTGAHFQVTGPGTGVGATSDQCLNSIDGNRIVYSDNRSGNFDIYMYTFNLNTPPVAEAGPDVSLFSDSVAATTVHGRATDEDAGASLSYRWLEAGAVLLEWTPVDPSGDCALNLGQVSLPRGAHNLILQVSDGISTASDDMVLQINNSAPMLLGDFGPKTVNEGELLAFAVDASDPDGDPLVFDVGNLPSGAAFDPATRVFAWTTTYEQAGSYPNVLFYVTDNGNPPLRDSKSIPIAVGNVNRPPTLDAIGNKGVEEGRLLTFAMNATDPDGNLLTYSAGNLPTGANFDPATGTFTWTPSYDQAGNYPNVVLTVTDDGTPPRSAFEQITITVGNVNRPPALDPIGNRSVAEGQVLSFVFTGTDPDGDPLTFAASNVPTGATFDPSSQIFSWTPTFEQAGSYTNIRFNATDGGGLGASEAIAITVGNVNRPPVLNPIGAKTVLASQTLQFTVTGSDCDGDPLTFNVAPIPPGATFDGQTFSWVPGDSQSGNYEVIFSVQDNLGAADMEHVTITVGNINRSPVFDVVGPKQLIENQQLKFYVNATDPDGGTLTYSAGNLPTGASFNPATRLFSWTPDYGQAGSYTVSFYAADDGVPAMIAETGVFVSVGQPSPAQLIDAIIQRVRGSSLPLVEKLLYLVDLGIADKFIDKGRMRQAGNLLSLFICAIEKDIQKGRIGSSDGNKLIQMTTELRTKILN